ncbi:MAG TPA: glycine zipper 2TM domain-containing protein [Dokdonella sp.]|uniref:glycine zipper 2TM domain-containing protein n=1 Tax=Dokdonella sp. TaxID=2291710 RepID=UPI002D7FC536|nr:glycine zipper 2TM domain-containing protein [Dokdonella sp.]HET9034122.1 glycine zipper 2TM domain-containing protein [Dokdonella sp.]
MLNRLLLAGVTSLALAACVPMQPTQVRGNYYDRGCDSCGQIIQISSIGQSSNHLGGGTVLGAIVGGALGNQVGKGDGRNAATIAGAVAGGAIGHQVEKNNRQSPSVYRIVVRMDRGGTRTYRQDNAYRMRRGDRVYIDNGYVVPAR